MESYTKSRDNKNCPVGKKNFMKALGKNCNKMKQAERRNGTKDNKMN